MANDIVPVTDPVRRATFGDQLRRNALRQPDRAAVVGYGGPNGEGRTELSFAELNARANRLANSLAAQGVGKGDVMALVGRNNPGSIVAFWAAAKLGVAVTGVNFTFTESELHYQLEHSGAKVIVCEDALVDRIDTISSPLPDLTIRVANDVYASEAPSPWQRMSALIESGSGDEPDGDVDEHTLGIIPYTSGTTSLPKAVAIPQRNYFVSMIPSYTTGIGLLEEDVWYFTMPLHTIAGMGMQICLLSFGNTIVLPFSVDVDAALDALVEENVTVVGQTPTFYLQLIGSPKFAGADLSRLRRCITYGGTMPQAMFDAFETAAPDVVWITLWSQSEITQTPTIGRFKSLADVPNGDAAWIGKPTAQLEVRVVDEEGNEAEEGELLVRSPGAMAGYYKDPERTAEVVRDGWIHTNDLVRIDEDGNLYFVDRRHDVIKTGGMNVSSVEVERTLYTHPAVLEVAVVGLADPYWMQVVTAFVVPKGAPEDFDADEVRAFCKNTLAGYKVPKEIRVVAALPKDTQGKILKRQLRADAEARSGRAAGLMTTEAGRHAGPRDLASRAVRGERRALSQVLSVLERGGEQADLMAAELHPHAGDTFTVGLTGAPGAGKSTLTDALVAEIRRREQRIAVVAIDPSSPFTGGAILGDRVRLRGEHAQDDEVFMRSLSNRGHLGGLSRAVPDVVRAFGACGWSTVIVETVGVGQVEVEIAGQADTTVVVVNPGWGDEVQANKAGLLEVADVLIVNKADREGARSTMKDLRQMLALALERDWRPPIVATVATEDEGVAEAWEAILAHYEHAASTGELERRRTARLERDFQARAIRELTVALQHTTERTEAGRALLARLRAGELALPSAVAELMELVRDGGGR